MHTAVADMLLDPSGLCLKGSGWDCVLDKAEIKLLAARLQVDGHWSLAFKVRRHRSVSLDINEKRDLVETLDGMKAAGFEFSGNLRRLSGYLDDDLFAIAADVPAFPPLR